MKQLILTAMVLAVVPLFGQQQHRTVGSGPGSNSSFATDYFPGFDGLDDLPIPEKKEKGWFWRFTNNLEADNAIDQLGKAKAYEAARQFKKAAKAADSLVREWPSSAEAAEAQLLLAKSLEAAEEYDDAFEEYSYLLDFYSDKCRFSDVVTTQYRLANYMMDTRATFLGMSFTGLRELRQNYEKAVRRAPGEAWVPQAMIRICTLREMGDEYEEAIKVYATIRGKFAGTQEASLAYYREANARMWLVRRLAYNLPRCIDTAGFLKMALRRDPDNEGAEEMRTWLTELENYMAEDAWTRTRFYDSKQRTRHSALAAYEKFLKEHPNSPHAEEAREQIEKIQGERAERTAK